MVFRFCFRSKRNGVRTPPTSEERVRGEYIRAHFSEDFQQCDHNRKDLCFKHCISTSDCCCDHLWTTSLCACAHFVDTVDYYMNVVSLTPEVWTCVLSYESRFTSPVFFPEKFGWCMVPFLRLVDELASFFLKTIQTGEVKWSQSWEDPKRNFTQHTTCDVSPKKERKNVAFKLPAHSRKKKWKEKTFRLSCFTISTFSSELCP